MPSAYSFREVREKIEKAIPDREKREFIMGYLEGLAEHGGGSSSEWQISREKLESALERLGVGSEAAARPHEQISSAEISQIQKHLQDRPRF